MPLVKLLPKHITAMMFSHIYAPHIWPFQFTSSVVVNNTSCAQEQGQTHTLELEIVHTWVLVSKGVPDAWSSAPLHRTALVLHVNVM
jgi:hypothetical protein